MLSLWITEHLDTEVDALDTYSASLPGAPCTACAHWIPRRTPRVQVRASWREHADLLCLSCWSAVCRWAERFALQQAELPLD